MSLIQKWRPPNPDKVSNCSKYININFRLMSLYISTNRFVGMEWYGSATTERSHILTVFLVSEMVVLTFGIPSSWLHTGHISATSALDYLIPTKHQKCFTKSIERASWGMYHQATPGNFLIELTVTCNATKLVPGFLCLTRPGR